MVYGIVSHLDDLTTKAFLKSKKVAEESIVYNTQLYAFSKALKQGDVVYVISVNRFNTVSQFMSFGKFCFSKGVSLHILSQPYLDIYNGKCWKASVIKQMSSMVEIERMATGKMTQSFKMSNEQWEFVFRIFQIMNLEVLGQIFSSDGVLKRGS